MSSGENPSSARIAAPPSGPLPVVVVVDDDHAMRRLIVKLVASARCEVREASSAESGRQLLEELGRVDLVVTDVGLPEMNGADFGRWLRGSARHRDVPILFVTAFTAPGIEATLRQTGGGDILHKPFRPNELVDRVKRILERNPRRGGIVT